MNRYREHWNPNHPAVRDWIDRHPDACDSLAYRRAMVRQRRGINPPRNHDRLRATTGITILVGALITAGTALSFALIGAGTLVLLPFLKGER